MPESIGYAGDAEHDQLVDTLDQQTKFLAERLQPIVSRALRHKALYLRASRRFGTRSTGNRSLQPGQDPGRGSGKKEGMQYQSTAVVPLAFRTVETKAAAFTDLLFSADPLIECDAVFDKEYGEGARFITRQIDHAIEGNRMRSMLPAVLRDAFSDGIKWIRPVWRKMARRVWVNSGPDDVSKWNEAILNASAAMTREGDTSTPLQPELSVEEDPESWQRWVELARGAGHKIPDMPVTGRQLVVNYEGPWFYRPGLGEVLYDPECEFEDQRLLVYSCEVTEDYLKQMSDPEKNPAKGDPSKPWLASQVEYALGGHGNNATVMQRLQDARKTYYEMLGLDSADSQKDKLFGQRHLLEYCYRPGDEANPYLVILNKAAIINKDTTQYEYEHGMPPLVPIRHLRLDGSMVGVSAIHQGEPLMKEADRVLAYTLDALLFSVLPVFTKLKNSPLPEGLQRLSAGTLIPVDRHDVLAQLTKTVPDMQGAIQMIQFFMSLIDDTESTPPSLRGAASTVGRVSATEESGRKTQALSRIKLLASGVEDDLQPLIQQSIGLYYQFYQDPQRAFVAGMGDPLSNMNRAMLQAALQAKFRFRGASRAVNVAERIQQLFTWVDKFASVMTPHEIRQFAIRVADEMGIKRRDDFLMADQTKALELQAKATAAQQTAQAMMVLNPQPQPVPDAAAAGMLPPGAPPEMAGQATQAPAGAPPPAAGGNGAPPPVAAPTEAPSAPPMA